MGDASLWIIVFSTTYLQAPQHVDKSVDESQASEEIQKILFNFKYLYQNSRFTGKWITSLQNPFSNAPSYPSPQGKSQDQVGGRAGRTRDRQSGGGFSADLFLNTR